MSNGANHAKTVKKLVFVVIGMFGFGFALVPLYDVFCEITGLNGKTSQEAAVYKDVQVDTSRVVTVEFISRTSGSMPWTFRPVEKEVTVHPGEMKQVSFYAKNDANSDIIGQAVPSVSPGLGAQYLNKTDCFCFNQQPLKAGEETEMTLLFFVDPDLPEEIGTLTLSYTLYDITAKAS